MKIGKLEKNRKKSLHKKITIHLNVIIIKYIKNISVSFLHFKKFYFLMFTDIFIYFKCVLLERIYIIKLISIKLFK